MRVVVTGGAGFIGANLCRALAATDGVDHVVAFDDLSTGSRANLDGVPGVALVEGSILDRRSLDDALEGADSVIHLAARPSVARSLVDPMATHQVNVTGTVQVLAAAQRSPRRHVVVASSSSVYGANPELPKRETLAPLPVSPYAASKLAAESYALAWAPSFDLGVLALRFFNVFGPLQPADHAYAAVVPAFISAALAGRPIPLHGDGRQTRDFTYVDSVVEVLVAAAVNRVTSPGPVNLAFSSRVSLLTLIDLLRSLVGSDLTVEHLPPRAGDVRDSQADSSRLRELFPGCRPVPLEKGLGATLDWFRSRS